MKMIIKGVTLLLSNPRLINRVLFDFGFDLYAYGKCWVISVRNIYKPLFSSFLL